MSWIRSAMNSVVSASEKSSISQTLRHVADAVAGLAVSVSDSANGHEDDRMPHHSDPVRNLRSFKHTVKGMEELSVSSRGAERVFLLRRWLVALKLVERITKNFEDDNSDDNISRSRNHGNGSDKEVMYDEPIDRPRKPKPSLIYYYDPDVGDEPMNFRDVFLSSNALEGITESMILEAPNEEEVSILLELFRLCLTGGEEVHRELVNGIQDLAKAFSRSQTEVMVNRGELLQYAQSAIAGLKINADIERIDSEAYNLKETIDKMKTPELPSNNDPAKSSEGNITTTIDALKEARMQIRLLFEMKDLLLKKKSFKIGDSPQLHSEKVVKLKILSESLVNSTAKVETQISEYRSQRKYAVRFRRKKTEEVIHAEKDLVVEINELERQRNDIEVRLKEVNKLLTNACARLNNAREEIQHFDDASNQILTQLKIKEDELVRSAASCRAETDVVNACIRFMEDAWALQSSYMQQKEKQVNGDLERYGELFLKLVIHILSSYKEELGSSLTRFREVVKTSRSGRRAEVAQSKRDGNSEKGNSRNNLEEEYREFATKFKTAFRVVNVMKKQIYGLDEGTFRKDVQRIEELFQALKKIQEEFESIEKS